MITPAYSPTATERVLPRMALDFTTGVLDPRVTVTRALNTATRINASGLVEIVNANLPRFDYNPTTLAPKGLLIEESRTNLLLYSEQFDNPIWTKGSGGAGSLAVVTPNTAIGPDGTLSADRLQLNAGGSTISDFSLTQQIVTGLANPHAAARTVWMKSNTGASFQVALRELSSNTFVVVTVGNTWTRFELSNSGLATVNDGLQIILRGTYGTSQTADILIYGAQLEVGAFATSYIPTTTTSLTRNADNVQMTGTNFSSWYNQNEGTFEVSVDLKAKSVADNYPLRIAGGTNAIVIGYNETATLIRPINTSTTGATVTISAAAYTAVGGYSYTANKVRGAANATLSGTETAAGTVGVNTLAYIGSFNGGAGMLNGWVSKIMYWPQRLTNNEVQAFSKV